jgi:hypothetical protein
MKIRKGFVSNSSSSCFIINANYRTGGLKKDFSSEEIVESLKIMLDCYKKLFDFDLTYDEVFDDPKIIDKDFLENVLIHYLRHDDGMEVTDKKTIATLNAKKKKCKVRWKNSWQLTDKNKFYIADYMADERKNPEHWWVIDVKDIMGKTAIMSASDNSIPGELFELIELKFQANRIHMG